LFSAIALSDILAIGKDFTFLSLEEDSGSLIPLMGPPCLREVFLDLVFLLVDKLNRCFPKLTALASASDASLSQLTGETNSYFCKFRLDGETKLFLF